MAEQRPSESRESAGARERLLAAEGVDAVKMTRLRNELTNVFTAKLTSRGICWWVAGLCSSLLFAAWGACILFSDAGMDDFLTAIWWIYTAANVLMAAFSGYVLWRKEFDYRWGLTLSKLSPAASLIIALLIIMRAVTEPTVSALAWALFGLILLSFFALAITLYNRIVVADLGNREQLLRLELRLVELAERFQEASRPTNHASGTTT